MSISRKQVKESLEMLSHVGVLLAIPFFFIQQTADRQSRRDESAMQFIVLANDKYAELNSTLSKPWEAVNVSDFLQSNPTSEGIVRAKLAITESVSDSDIEKMAEFYKSVLICRSAHCDKKIVDDFFKTNIAGFYCSYDERLKRIAVRLNRPDYAIDLAQYVGHCD